MDTRKYKHYQHIPISDRRWPDRRVTEHPIWCSVDLRDGNQALITPMTIEEKLSFFELLVKLGFKEIEIGFPSAAQVEFDFVRELITRRMIPNDVSIQVLVQARQHLIDRTFQSLIGARNPIVHMYNSTSTNQRDIVFNKSMPEIIDIAIQGIRWIKEYQMSYQLPVILEYSPESFTGTEPENALAICNAVIREWQPAPDRKMIINLPSTVELSTPNIYADYIEWMHRNMLNRESLILSVHTHNDRGCAAAAAELALLAGADRIEGTLFGNGERTGNADIVTLALNMYAHGVHPGLDFSRLMDLRKQVEEINKISVHERHPYAGDLVFTAFSGSHQDAINKGLACQTDKRYWEVPYLPIDPCDIGRTYEGIIRINSQSGKGGVAYVLKKDAGYSIPKKMQPEVSRLVQQIADSTGREISPQEIVTLFRSSFINLRQPIELIEFIPGAHTSGTVECNLIAGFRGQQQKLSGQGNGPLDACRHALSKITGVPAFDIGCYDEHSLGTGSDSRAVCFIEAIDHSGRSCFGVGEDTDITLAAIHALVSAVNRLVVG